MRTVVLAVPFVLAALPLRAQSLLHSHWLPLGIDCNHLRPAGSGVALAPLTQPQWSLPVPLPFVPQFAGIDIALQAFFSPTSGALGFDLSNGVWARLG